MILEARTIDHFLYFSRNEIHYSNRVKGLGLNYIRNIDDFDKLGFLPLSDYPSDHFEVGVTFTISKMEKGKSVSKTHYELAAEKVDEEYIRSELEAELKKNTKPGKKEVNKLFLELY